ncbi:MAG: hypothetical protein ACLP9K_04615 [Nitrososphaerales archaeon]
MRTSTNCPNCGSAGYVEDYREAPDSDVKYYSRLVDRGFGLVTCKKCNFTGPLKEFTKTGKPANATREDIPIDRLTRRARRLYLEHIDEAEYNTRAKGENHP